MKLLSVGCRALVVFVLALGSVPALAATGDIVQKPGAAGCISNQAADAFPSCGLGRELRLGGGPGVPSVVVSPDGNSVYTAGNGYANGRQGSAVAIFDRDSGGTLAQKSGTAGCVTPDGMAGDPPVAGGCAAVPAIAQARALTVSPDAKNVYVAAGNGIVIFDRDASGALVQKPATAGCITDDGSPAGEPAVKACQDGTALRAPISVAVSPDGKNVYVAAVYSSAVAVFDRDTTTGELTQKQGLAGCMSDIDPACAKGKGLSYVRSVKVSPDGKNVYLAAYYGSMLAVLQRNTTTGELTQVSGTAACVSEGGLDTSVYPPIVGACTAAKGVRYPYDLTISPDGKNAYVTGEASAVATLDRDPATGSLSQRPGPAACISEDGSADGEGPNVCTMGKGLARPSAVIVSPDGLSVYAVAGWANSSSGVVAIIRRDPVTGVLTQRAAKAGCVSSTGLSNGDDPDTAGFCAIGRALYGGSGLTVSPDGKNVYVTAERGGLGIYDRELDVTAPQTTITAGPGDGSSTAERTPTFSFASNEPGSAYACSVDGAPFVACASPLTTSPLGAGLHTFAVRATDIDANAEAQPATRTFTVTVSAPAPPVPSGGGSSP
ncbi:MAG: hypothetical protein H0W96_03975, partial [Solirubrobacterales bacterium]|nr:hypothetical protein [Solirubrobacterales bacterium]